MVNNKPEVLIAIIGATGAGKTTFISKATGRDDLPIGHGIDSCTKEVLSYTFEHLSKRVTLIDTPGFDDSFTSDADILEKIAEFLDKTYRQKRYLSGLILLHPISGNKAGYHERKRTRLFKKLLGEEAYDRVIIGTTMWDQVAHDAHGIKQQQERMETASIWGDMVQRGASVVRHDNNKESVMELINKIMGFDTVKLQLQVELQQHNGNLSATSAGQQMNDDFNEIIQEMQKKLDNAKKEFEMNKKDRDEKIEELTNQIIILKKNQYSVRCFIISKWSKTLQKTAGIIIKFGRALEDVEQGPQSFGLAIGTADGDSN